MSYPIRRRCKGFLSLLQRTRSVVAGETALSVFLSGSNVGNMAKDRRDLEIFSPKGEVPRILSYLVEYEKYCIGRRTRKSKVPDSIIAADPRHDTNDDSDEDQVSLVPTPQSIHGEAIESITYLERDRDHQRIIIVESSSSSALTPVSDAPTTLLVNYFTSTTLVSMYPKLTKKGRGFRNPGKRSERDDAIVERYEDYALTIQEAPHDAVACRYLPHC